MGKTVNKKTKSQTTVLRKTGEPQLERVRLILLGLYFFSVAARFILALICRHGATVVIDESLYINIAKSLALEGEIAYRSQPVPYLYLFYPILLVPLYLLRLPFDIYRAIQLYNAFLMSSVIFPVYLFSRDFTESKRKALICSAVTLLMPDMGMAGFLMTECVVWPLTMWVFFFAYRLYTFDEGKIKNAVFTGIFTALLFWTKPGSMAPGATVLIIAIAIAAVKKEKPLLKAALAGTGVMAAMIALFYALYVFAFGYGMTVLGLYDKQLTEVNLKWFLAVLETSVLQLLLLAIASCGIFAILPYAMIGEYPRKQKRFMLAAAAGIAVSAVGTAALVDMYCWNESFTNMQLHLRYLAMYVPVLFIFSQQISTRKDKPGRSVFIAIAAVAVLTVFPGARVGSVLGESTNIDSMALSGFMRTTHLSSSAGIVLGAALTLFLVFLTIELRNGISSELKRLCVLFFAAFLIFNNYTAYHISNDIYIDPVFTADAIEMNAMIEKEEEPVLGITQQYYDDIHSYWLETHIRKPVQQVTIENIIVEAQGTGGVYVPFVPVDQAPNRNNHITADADTFLLGATIAEHLELNESVEAQKTSNGVYTLVHAQKGERWADTMLFGLNQNTLSNGKTAHLFIFDESRFENGQTTLRIKASAKDDGTVLKVTNNQSVTEFPLTADEAEYVLEISQGSITMATDGGDATILTYTTGK